MGDNGLSTCHSALPFQHPFSAFLFAFLQGALLLALLEFSEIPPSSDYLVKALRLQSEGAEALAQLGRGVKRGKSGCGFVTSKEQVGETARRFTISKLCFCHSWHTAGRDFMLYSNRWASPLATVRAEGSAQSRVLSCTLPFLQGVQSLFCTGRVYIELYGGQEGLESSSYKAPLRR